MKQTRLILTFFLSFIISYLASAQTFDFNDGTVQGWYFTGPHDNAGGTDLSSNFSLMYWDDGTSYPNSLGQDPIGNSNGSMTVVADGGHGITGSEGTFWILRFHSPNMAELTEWQNADGYTVQINEDMGTDLYANLYVRVYDFDLQEDRNFYSGVAQPLTSNSWNYFRFDNWSSIEGWPTNYQVEEIFVNIWGSLSDLYYFEGPVSIDQIVMIPRTSDITIATNPAGLDITVDGETYSAPQTFTWTAGSEHTIATTSPQDGDTGVQYVFDNWSDGEAMSHTITTPGTATTYTANFTTQYYLTMVAGTGGTVSPPSGWYNAGTGVQIEATPTGGYSFVSWTGSGSGNYTGTNNPATATMNGPISETASFTLDPVTITVNTNIGGRSFTVDGTSYTSQQVFNWIPGSQHTIATTSPQDGDTGVQYVFDNWSDGEAMSHTITTPGTATTYTANFTTQYYLTMVAGTGGTVSPPSGWYNAGTGVQIEATPTGGYSFVSWTGSGSGNYTGTNNPATATMNGPISETASFTLDPVTITVNTNIGGRSFTVDGTSYTSQQVFNWIPGSQHTIATTSPQDGDTGVQYVFDNWSDGGAMSHTITSPGTATTYTANFTTQYYLTMVAGTGGTVSPPSGWYNAGTGVQIEATPTGGYSFVSWTGSGSGNYTGTNNPATATMNGPISETASFTLDPVTITVNTNIGGRSFTVDGTSYTSQQVFNWIPGSQHTIATTSPQDGDTGVQYVFDNWSDGEAMSHTITTPGTATTYTANFTTQYYLTMVAGTGGTVSPPSGWYNAGTGVQIEATANDGYEFDEWEGTGSGAYTGTNNPATVTMDEPITQTASFSLIDAIELLDMSIPTEFALHYNYPNPFNPSTTIVFSIPENADVTLKIYNVLGMEVATLLSQRFPIGNYAYQWDASNLAGGVYYYIIRANNFQQAKKMVLVK